MELGNQGTKYVTYVITSFNVNRTDNSRESFVHVVKLQRTTHLLFSCKRGIDALSYILI